MMSLVGGGKRGMAVFSRGLSLIPRGDVTGRSLSCAPLFLACLWLRLPYSCRYSLPSLTPAFTLGSVLFGAFDQRFPDLNQP